MNLACEAVSLSVACPWLACVFNWSEDQPLTRRADVELVGRAISIKEGTLVKQVVAGGAGVGQGDLDLGVADWSQVDGERRGAFLEVDGGGTDGAGQSGHGSHGVLHVEDWG